MANEPMSAEALAAIEARASAIPHGEDWQAHEDSWSGVYEVFYLEAEEGEDDIRHVAEAFDEAHAQEIADFIAHAPADVRALVAEVRRLTALCDERTRERDAAVTQVGEWDTWYEQAAPTVMAFVFWSLNLATEAAAAGIIGMASVNAEIGGLSAAFQRATTNDTDEREESGR